ncbi:MAG TPA: hypothetical protein DDW73_23315 [Rhizobium sp.]|nr:hypothetical protein [Rhizobium sp.]
MHLLPQSFVFQTTHSSSQGASVGTAALLLPAAVRFFSESLPHLLPRQAFSLERGTACKASKSRSTGSCAIYGAQRFAYLFISAA